MSMVLWLSADRQARCRDPPGSMASFSGKESRSKVYWDFSWEGLSSCVLRPSNTRFTFPIVDSFSTVFVSLFRSGSFVVRGLVQGVSSASEASIFDHRLKHLTNAYSSRRGRLLTAVFPIVYSVVLCCARVLRFLQMWSIVGV
jgi:hypothetical protein